MSQTTQKGAIAEAAITLAAIEMGIVVLRPAIEGRRYDLVFDIDHRLYRVQCKWARRTGAVLNVNLESCRHTPHGYVRTKYDRTEIDAVVATARSSSAAIGCRSMSWKACGRSALRLTPAANNQQLAINFAADYELGAIAQLGERVTGSHEVAGSSPASSTSRPS